MSGGISGMDIRLPMGLLFLDIGVRVLACGVRTQGAAVYQTHSEGINVNLWWGAVLALFGLLNLALTWMARNKAQAH